MARLTLSDVSIPRRQRRTVYDDGGLFAGHAVLVSMDAQGNFADADVAG